MVEDIKETFGFGRKICRETKIPADKGVVIAAPYGEQGFLAALSLKDRLESLGYKALLLKDPDHELLLHGEQPIIVLGNLADSQCVKYMYYKFMCITDKSYPGKEGYSIRTIVDPFATGYNVIHIGYSDEKGLYKGVKAFTDKIADPIPFFNEVSCIESPFDPEILEYIKNTTLPEKIELIPSIHTSFWWLTGFAAYVTGDSKSLAVYYEGWRKMIELSKKDPAIIGSTHLYFTQHMEGWRLMEYSGLIPDDLRGPIEQCVFDWAESREGKEYAARHSGKDLPSHNHTMFCAVSLMYASDFFGKHYPDLEQPKEWKRLADRVFETFNEGGWKPYCDDSAYSNQVTLPLVCSYSIFEDDHTFLNTSGKIAAEWLKAIIGQNGIVPSFGDGTVRDPFPVAVTRLFSHYYQDRELRWLHDRMYEYGEYPLGIVMHRLFDSGVKPVQPVNPPKINIFPLDRYFYDIWDKDESEGIRMSVMPPNGPYEQCFDKASIRTGWDEDKDDFLLMDGLGSNGVHAYNDAMGILDYTSKGIVWLVEENCYRWPEPEHCNILTISKAGYAASIPGYALLEEQKEISPSRFYVRMRLKDYNGCDWIREIHLIKGVCALFHDTVIPNEEGEYVIQARFRTPAKARLEGNCMKSLRKDKEGNTYELRLSSYSSSDYSVRSEEIPYGKTLFTYGGMHEKEFIFNHFTNQVMTANKVWERRYHDNSMVISAMITQASSFLKKNERISFTHVVHPAKPGDDELEYTVSGNTILLKKAGKEYECMIDQPVQTQKCNTASGQGQENLQNQALPEKVFEFRNDITGMVNVQPDQILCAIKGEGLAFLSSGKVLWEKPLEGDIHAMDVIPEEKMLLVGYGHNKLLALDMEGRGLWETKTVRIPTLFDSWEYEYPRIVKLSHFIEEGKTYILAGCGDNQLRKYDLKGELLHASYVYATVPDIIEFADVDQDGEPEILAAGSKTASSGTFRAFKTDGSLIRSISAGIWLSTINAHALMTEDKRVILACGMNYAKNFKVISVERDSAQTLFEKSLSGTVQGVCFNADKTKIVAGTSKGSVLAFDKEGNHLWHVSVNDGIRYIGSGTDQLTVMGESGKVFVLTETGTIVDQYVLPGDVSCFTKDGNIGRIGCKNELYRISL